MKNTECRLHRVLIWTWFRFPNPEEISVLDLHTPWI